MCLLQLRAISCFFIISVRKYFSVMSSEEGSDSVQNEGSYVIFIRNNCFTDEWLSF